MSMHKLGVFGNVNVRNICFIYFIFLGEQFTHVSIYCTLIKQHGIKKKWSSLITESILCDQTCKNMTKYGQQKRKNFEAILSL